MEADAGDEQSVERLQMAELVLRMDPFRRQISVAKRDKTVVEAFETAGERLHVCGASRGPALPTAAQSSLAASWARLKPRISGEELKRDPDLVEAAMDLVFEIEPQTSATCGPPSGSDMALLLIAKLHEGN